MDIRIPLIFFLLLLISGCSEQQNTAQTNEKSKELRQTDTSSEREVLIVNLNVPWAITKTEENFFISERNGSIVEWNASTNEIKRKNVELSKAVHQEGEGGFLGIELLPDFQNTQRAFAYHTYKENGDTKNRVVVLERGEDSWKEIKVLLEDIPGEVFHNGGRLKIGPDLKLYITTGDALQSELAQNTNSLAGKILRMNLDGSVPEDNPFTNSYVYSYGHRNSQGLAWDEEGQLYSSEHGQEAHDELNKIEPGQNYGWPDIQGDEEKNGMQTPLFHTGNITWGPSGISYKDGKLYVAALRGEAIMVYPIEGDEAETFIDGEGRIRDVLIDGNSMYYITNNTDGRGTPAENDDKLVKVNIE
ncbi:PQQ-dependent sugar dehydrogenase [Metabacillus arenae]|uniref:Sorbosone dehydrogenase family protein n=1 Tax=Metabacillus arenae TaxID=2771434 RepID=A0A926NGI9_9BACI|nr:PQQ-dependent sugar dehydrogenase [Metabacillus arenae]MBD1380876.1 sorbosone dehydrogenase family protein [Metabacillus arenae]